MREVTFTPSLISIRPHISTLRNAHFFKSDSIEYGFDRHIRLLFCAQVACHLWFDGRENLLSPSGVDIQGAYAPPVRKIH